MKLVKYLVCVCSTVASLGFATGAQATTIVNTFDPPNVLVTSTTAYRFIHDLSAELQPLTISGGSTLINWATLDIYLHDQQGGNEKLEFLIGSNGSLQSYTQNGNNNIPNGNSITPYTIALLGALPDLQEDGKLNVMLSVLSQSGDYQFVKSVLKADVSVVPEPAPFALLGIGLLGLTLRRSKNVFSIVASCR